MAAVKEIRPRIDFESNPVVFAEASNDRVESALFVAAQIHEGDRRKISKEPYLHHCVAVASILESWGADEDLVVAGLLHDTVEDHPDLIDFEDVERLFGKRVAALVWGVTKFKSREGKESDFETLRKVTKESLIDYGVAIIKLADRLHNMMTLEGMPELKRIAKAKETLAVYTPLAESFGLWQIKNALADLSFMNLEEKRYWRYRRVIDEDPRLGREFIENMEMGLARILRDGGVTAVVEHQVGGYWEMVDKQRRAGMSGEVRPGSFYQIADLVSFRVIVDGDDLATCYRAMGVVRQALSGQLDVYQHDDYLISPSVNGYSAIHDTYRLREGWVEVAFTTRKKENFNNWGVMALPKEEIARQPELYLRKLVFTPKEELIFMDPQAKGIDVAYKLNPLLGLRARTMRIDGEECGLEVVVPNSAVVEILTDQRRRVPNREWLRSCNEETREAIERP